MISQTILLSGDQGIKYMYWCVNKKDHKKSGLVPISSAVIEQVK